MSIHEKHLAEKWHKQVAGIWHGCPGIFDAEGNSLGHVQADRSIFVEDEGQHLIKVETKVDCTGSLRSRLETPMHLLRVKHLEDKRVYEGPDFYGTGYPYGSLILGNDYCVPWHTDNRVHVQLLPGTDIQAYSNVAIEGNTVVGVITGLYQQSQDYETNPETREKIDAYRLDEIKRRHEVHLLPRSTPGTFRGKLETYTPDQKCIGETTVEWKHIPHTQYTCRQEMTLSGAYERQVNIERSRHENHHFFEDGFWGNAIGYGRALFWTGHFRGETTRLKGRDFQLDNHSRGVVWEFFRADTLEYVMHGVLDFEPA